MDAISIMRSEFRIHPTIQPILFYMQECPTKKNIVIYLYVYYA